MIQSPFAVAQSVRILHCPTNHQHDGQVGEVLEVYGRILRVELESGERCWPYQVEAIESATANQ